MMSFFFFNDTATTEIYTLSLHDALPISTVVLANDTGSSAGDNITQDGSLTVSAAAADVTRTEKHTSEPQSRQYTARPLLLEDTNVEDAPDKARHTASASHTFPVHATNSI